MVTYETAEQISYDLLEDVGFGQKRLSEHSLPSKRYIRDGDQAIPYAVHGDLDAPNVILHSTPYLTRLDPHFSLRLQAQQAALGDEYCVVGVEAYNPSETAFHKDERRRLSSGDFSPLSERMLRVGEHIGQLTLRDMDNISFYGYSMGADVAVQTAYDALTNENRGVIGVGAIGAVEPARSVHGRGLKVMLDMQQSGKRMFRNILESDVPALNEAWNIDNDAVALGKIKAQEIKNMGKVVFGAGAYLLRSPRSNYALIKGFGTSKSVDQLWEIGTKTDTPIFLGRARDSKVFPEHAMEPFVEPLNNSEHGLTHIIEDDHSADDNIRKSAARILYFASNLIED